MNEDIKNKLIDWLQYLEEGMKSASDFTAEQVPIVIQEYLALYFWESAFYCGIGVLLIFLGAVTYFIVARPAMKKWAGPNRTTEAEDSMGVIGMIASITLPVGGTTLSTIMTYYMIRVTVAPRVVILEKVSELLRQVV
jgi:hypothetical protein